MASLLTEPPRPRAVREHPRAPWFAVASVCVGAFMGQLDASIVTLAFPATTRRYFRVTVTANSGRPAGRLSEMQIWNG